MIDLARGNAAIGQSGGPTAVINQSLVGVVEGLRSGLKAAGHVNRIVGMRHGVQGLLPDGGDLVDFSSMHQDRLDLLARSPSACLGSTRVKPDDAYCARVLEGCRRHDVRYFFYIGGNDSADTCRLVSEQAEAAGYDLRCFHVPKTIDNDLVENDHTPGYASAARYVAMACMADFMDNISLPGIKLNVIMGRSSGFLTAAAALARRRDLDLPLASTDGPQLIYVPEVPFDEDGFLADVESVYRVKGRCHIVVSEGIKNAAGLDIGATLIAAGQVDAHGNAQLSGSGALGDLLATRIKTRLTPQGGKPPRVRADTFGYVQRCWPDPSLIDAIEARRVGRYAAQAAMSGARGVSVVIRRLAEGADYRADFDVVPVQAVARKTRHLPPEFLDGTNNVSRAFLDYALPLVGPLPTFERL